MYAPNGAPLYYAAPAGMIPAPGGVGQRPAMVYQQMMPRGGGGQGWRAQGGGMRPNYQQAPGYPVSRSPNDMVATLILNPASTPHPQWNP